MAWLLIFALLVCLPIAFGVVVALALFVTAGYALGLLALLVSRVLGLLHRRVFASGNASGL